MPHLSGTVELLLLCHSHGEMPVETFLAILRYGQTQRENVNISTGQPLASGRWETGEIIYFSIPWVNSSESHSTQFLKESLAGSGPSCLQQRPVCYDSSSPLSVILLSMVLVT